MKLDKRIVGKYIPINNNTRRDLAVLISTLVSTRGYIKNARRWYDCQTYLEALKWIDGHDSDYIRIVRKNNCDYLFQSFKDKDKLYGLEKADPSYLLSILRAESIQTEENYEVH